MPGHIEDDAIAGAQLVAAGHDADRKASVELAKHEHANAPEDLGKAQSALPVEDKDFKTLGEGLDDFPTEEDLVTLRRVSAHIPAKLFTIAFVELCERFSYYGTVILQPLPDGSRTGAGFEGQSGALGMGQRASTGITTFNQFWQYFMPLFGAYVADELLGRYKTIVFALAIDIIGHIILVSSAVPAVITKPGGNSLGALVVGIIIIGFGTGGFKPNISPLIVEQLPIEHLKVQTLKSGERVLVDPAITISRVYNYFYLFINIGSVIGQVSMVYAEKYVGFWLSFLLPTCMLCVAPLVMWWGKNKYEHRPPTGSVLGKALKVWMLAQKGRWHIFPWVTYKNMHDGTFWSRVKPSNFAPGTKPRWMTFDDAWVDEVARGFTACKVFMWYPIFWLTYNQINNNLVSQAAVMRLNGVPNDVISNLDPIAVMVLILLCDLLIYPFLRRMGIKFTPIKKITAGFFTGAMAMIWAAVIQAYIYKYSECGTNAAGKGCEPVSISVWAQSGSYILVALSEIFASITSLEYAFSKAPKNMRSMIQAIALFAVSIAAAIGEGFVSVSEDPLLVWNYGAMAVLAFIAGILFWLQFRHVDHEEDTLNELPEGKMYANDDEESSRHSQEATTTTATEKH